MWELVFYLVGAAAAAAVALHLKRQFAGSGCASCPYKGNCAKGGGCQSACPPPGIARNPR